VEEGSAIGLLILLAYTVVISVVELHTHKRYFRHTFAISPTFIVSWGGISTRMYLENKGFILFIGLTGFALSIFSLMYKIYSTAVDNAQENSKYYCILEVWITCALSLFSLFFPTLYISGGVRVIFFIITKQYQVERTKIFFE